MKKTILFLIATAITLCSCYNRTEQQNEDRLSDREALENIFSRVSVREFTDQQVEQEKIDLLVRAGMAAPSAMDRRPWEILVINDTEVMSLLSDELPYTQMLKTSPLAIVVCGNTERSTSWFIDCAAVSQNILLAAEALGLGAVWTGVYPYDERMEAVGSTFNLPENVLPFSLIPIGYAAGENEPKDKYDPSKVHMNRW